MNTTITLQGTNSCNSCSSFVTENSCSRCVLYPDGTKSQWEAAVMVINAAQPQQATDLDALKRDNDNLRTVMIAAAEEIQAHWDAHCDAEGYGPANLMHRLEKGIPSEYGYTAGAFAALKTAQSAAIDSAVAAERERCAALCEMWNTSPGSSLAKEIRGSAEAAQPQQADIENDPPSREGTDWTTPPGYDGDGSVAAMAARSAAQPRQAITGRPATGTEAEVIDDIRRRQALGINKYGATVRDNPLSLRQWLQHAYEECLDQAIYLKRAMEEMDRSQEELKHLNDEAGARTCEHCGCDMTKAFQDHKDGCPNIPL